MALIDIKHGTKDAPAYVPGSKVSVHEFIIDGEEMANRGVVPVAADEIEFMIIPRGGFVLQWHWEVSLPSDDPAAATFTIADEDGDVLAATDLKTVASGIVAGNKYYAAGQVVKSVVAGNWRNARVKVQVAVIPFHFDNDAVVANT